jgi:transposase-like protein
MPMATALRHPLQASPLDDPAWLSGFERTEERCRRYLEELRWPDGVSCPRCGSASVGDIPSRKRHYCRGCRHQFSLTSGTVFHNSHLPIWKWFLAVELLLESEGGLPANQLVDLLGGSYKTAWFVEHRIRAAFVQAGEHVPEARIAPSYHRPAQKYRPAYLAETCWRLRQRGNPLAFRNTVRALLEAEPVPYCRLTRARDLPDRPVASRSVST